VLEALKIVLSLVGRAEVIYLGKQLLVLHIVKLNRIVMMLPYLVNVLMDGLKALLLRIFGHLQLVDQVGQHFVPPLVE
jgi:hypothetical protein